MKRASDVLAERARHYALPLAQIGHAGVDVICFSSGGERFALEARHVLRVAPLPTVARLPGTRACMLGLASVRGAMLTIVDLGQLLGSPAPATRGYVVVVGRGHPDLGLVADESPELAAIPAGAPARDGTVAHDGTAPALIARILPDGRALVDGDALLDDRRLFVENSLRPALETS